MAEDTGGQPCGAGCTSGQVMVERAWEIDGVLVKYPNQETCRVCQGTGWLYGRTR